LYHLTTVCIIAYEIQNTLTSLLSCPISQSPGTIFCALCDMSWHNFLAPCHIYRANQLTSIFLISPISGFCDTVTKWEYSQISKFKKKWSTCDRIGRNCRNWLNGDDSRQNIFSLHANPLAWSLGQVKLDSDKWKLWKNLLE
jgi:hypothetical protein